VRLVPILCLALLHQQAAAKAVNITALRQVMVVQAVAGLVGATILEELEIRPQ
jgi:hypothetical protein